MRLSAEVSRLTVAAAAPAARRGVFEQELVLLILRRTGGCSENEEGRGEDRYRLNAHANPPDQRNGWTVHSIVS